MIKGVSLAFAIDVANIFDKYEISVTSWGRPDPAYNEAIGGHPSSRHITWDALDGVSFSEGDAQVCFAELKKRDYHGYVREAGERAGRPLWQIHIQRVAPA